ncbi:MAG: 4Fe-4S binding protein [Chloroflexi bacterium]|nr:4Fe-4S binding protein [Chloroflexota bacterium]
MGGPTIVRELCNGCGLCIDVCQPGGLVQIDGSVELAQSAECDDCGECEAVCPTGAIGFAYDIVVEKS